MSKCRRDCRSRGRTWPEDAESSPGCEYILITKHSRVKQAEEMLGVKSLTEEVEELLKPENCPFYEPGRRGKRRTNPVTWEEQDA